MSPWANGRQYLNFLEEDVDPSTGYDAASYSRLQSLNARWTRTAPSSPTTGCRADSQITLPTQR